MRLLLRGVQRHRKPNDNLTIAALLLNYSALAFWEFAFLRVILPSSSAKHCCNQWFAPELKYEIAPELKYKIALRDYNNDNEEKMKCTSD